MTLISHPTPPQHEKEQKVKNCKKLGGVLSAASQLNKYIYIYLRAAAPAADPGVHVREGKQLQRHKLDIIGGDMLDLFQLDEGFEESYTEVV